MGADDLAADDLAADDLAARLAEWTADARASEAAAERARQRWLSQQAAEDVSLAGVLTVLAERRSPVVVSLVTGRVVSGPVVAVGSDFCVVERSLVPFGALASVRGPAVLGSGLGAADDAGAALSFEAALARLVADRPVVSVELVGGAGPLRGELWAAGGGVVAVRLDDAERSTAYAAASAVASLTLVS
jgi:hypothetical protein